MGIDDPNKYERAIIQQTKTVEQTKTAVLVVSSDEILTVIAQVHACYDYCAAWKEPTQEEEGADAAEIQR